MAKKRTCGVLLPVSSLPSKYGIGCFDKKAYEFVDALKEAGEAPELYQTAEKNLQSAIEVLLSPILKTAGYTLMWE